MQTGYVGFDKDNSVTEILKCFVGKFSVPGIHQQINSAKIELPAGRFSLKWLNQR